MLSFRIWYKYIYIDVSRHFRTRTIYNTNGCRIRKLSRFLVSSHPSPASYVVAFRYVLLILRGEREVVFSAQCTYIEYTLYQQYRTTFRSIILGHWHNLSKEINCLKSFGNGLLMHRTFECGDRFGMADNRRLKCRHLLPG